jgi:hypothetical protein
MGRTIPITPMPINPMQSGIGTGMAGPQNFAPTAPSYEAGGMIGPQGAPVPMGAAPGQMPQMPAAQGVGVNPQMQQNTPMDFSMLEMQINQFASQHPEQIQQIRQVIQQELQSGGLTQQELNMMVQLATVAAQNPQMYPNVRQFAIQQGLATEQDLSPEYDQGLVFSILLAGRAAQGGQGGQGMQQAVPSMEFGGKVPPSQKNDGSVLINAHQGEYVIPRNVVEMKGKEFFDALVEKYKDGK